MKTKGKQRKAKGKPRGNRGKHMENEKKIQGEPKETQMKIKKTLKPQRETKEEEITENIENIWTEEKQRKSTKRHEGKHGKSRTAPLRLEKGCNKG